MITASKDSDRGMGGGVWVVGFCRSEYQAIIAAGRERQSECVPSRKGEVVDGSIGLY